MSYPGRSRQRESAVTTNGEKSAEAIVGGNAEGPNGIQFMNFRFVCQFPKTAWGQVKTRERAGN